VKKGLMDAVFEIMSDGRPWTFWGLQEAINHRYDCYYGEPTISAGIRALRRYDKRKKYGLPLSGEVLFKERIPSSDGTLARGYQYRLLVADGHQYKQPIEGAA